MKEEPDAGDSVDDRMVDLEDERGVVVSESCDQHRFPERQFGVERDTALARRRGSRTVSCSTFSRTASQSGAWSGRTTVTIGARSTGSRSIVQRNLGNHQAIASLPPFPLFPWLFVMPGLLAIGASLLARDRAEQSNNKQQGES